MVVKITDEREEFLTYVQSVGLVPGSRVAILQKTPFGDVLSLRVEGQPLPVAVGKEVAASIYVRVGDA